MTVEPPTVDDMFGDGTINGIPSNTPEGWDRDFWRDLAINVYQLDPDVIEEQPTEWIVARCKEEL